jgi:hypothetical protein
LGGGSDSVILGYVVIPSQLQPALRLIEKGWIQLRVLSQPVVDVHLPSMLGQASVGHPDEGRWDVGHVTLEASHELTKTRLRHGSTRSGANRHPHAPQLYLRVQKGYRVRAA